MPKSQPNVSVGKVVRSVAKKCSFFLDGVPKGLD